MRWNPASPLAGFRVFRSVSAAVSTPIPNSRTVQIGWAGKRPVFNDDESRAGLFSDDRTSREWSTARRFDSGSPGASECCRCGQNRQRSRIGGVMDPARADRATGSGGSDTLTEGGGSCAFLFM